MDTAKITARSLVIADREYQSDACAVVLDYLGLTELTIELDPGQIDLVVDKEPFTVTGTALLFSQSSNVELDIIPKDQGCDFVLVATLPELPDGILPPSIFVEPLRKAAKVDFLFDSQDLSAYFALLESDANHNDVPGLPLKRIGFEYLQSAKTKTLLSLNVHAEIDVGTTPIQVVLTAPRGGELARKVWTLKSPRVIPLGGGLAEITQFMTNAGGVPAANNTFPEPLTGIPVFFLEELSVLVNPSPIEIDFLTFRLTSARSLVLIPPNQLLIKNTGVRVNITPGKQPLPTLVALTIFGTIDIGDEAELEIDISVPANFRTDTWAFHATGQAKLDQINTVEKLPIGIGKEDLQLHSGFLELKSLSISLFEVDFNPFTETVSSIRFAVGVDATCHITHGLEVRNPRISFVSNNPFDNKSLPAKDITGAIDAIITVGDIDFGIEAAKRIDGWDFTGGTESKSIQLGRMISALETKYNITLPNVIRELEKVILESLTLKFSTLTTDKEGGSYTVSFSSELIFPLTDEPVKEKPDSEEVRLSFDAQITNNPVTHKFGGAVHIGSTEFGTKYSDDPKASYFVGAYVGGQTDDVKLKTLVEKVSTELAKAIPDGLGLVIKDAAFAVAKTEELARKFLFGFDVGVHLDFSRLPLVGKYFSGPDAKKIGVDNLKIVFASGPFIATEVQNLNQLLAALNAPGLPEIAKTADSTPEDPNTPVIQQGANISAILNLGSSSRPLSFPTSTTPQQTPVAQPIPNATTADSAFWLNIQKAIGPVHFERVGVEYRQAKLWVLLSASLTAAGLTISLDGLSLGTPLESFDLKPALRGLGIDYRNDFVEIGGSFSATPAKEPNAEPEYSGAVTLKARGLTISAFGKYTTLDNHPSMFIYGRLDYPIGGPPFFFVTGLAAGFGYQRSLVIPPIERLGQFSLIKAAQQGSSFIEVLQNPNLSKEIPPTAGQYFLAAGVIFTSFKIVESTVLLFVAFGKRFELHLLGLSKMRMPAALEGDAPVEPVAEVELAVKGSFIPDDGFLELRAQLTPTSYLFSKNCHLTGGFAFVCWFKPKQGIESKGPEGDFILTLGGYHPAFHVPTHYPTVPRLGFNWLVTEALSLRGEVYFALTPAAVMAGGYLQAEWQSGKIRAWFKAGIDFLIAWKPYHYDARAYIDIGVEVTFEFFGTQRISLDVGADLHIYGPDFAGEATVHLWIISFTIHFGSKTEKKQTIDWDEFQSSFLLKEKPKPAVPKPEVCSVVVVDGLVQKGDGNDLGVINGKHFCLRTDSRIPATGADRNGTALKLDKPAAAFGVAPVGIGSVKSSTHSITLMRDKAPAGDEFEFSAIGKRFPAALWGQSVKPQVNGPQFIEALSGFEIRPLKLQESDPRGTINRNDLVEHDKTPQQCHWEPGVKAFNPVTKTDAQFKTDLNAVDKSMRFELLKSLGIDSTGFDAQLNYDFLRQPQSDAA